MRYIWPKANARIRGHSCAHSHLGISHSHNSINYPIQMRALASRCYAHSHYLALLKQRYSNPNANARRASRLFQLMIVNREAHCDQCATNSNQKLRHRNWINLCIYGAASVSWHASQPGQSTSVMSQSIARGLLRHYTTLLSDDGLRRASREHGRGWVPWRKIFHIRHEKNDIYSDHMCL